MRRALAGVRVGVTRAAALMAAVAGWAYIGCALFITADIVGRSVLGVSSAATVEITGYLLAFGIAWSLAHALACRAHIRVDVWVARLPLRVRAVLHLVALALLGVFAAFCAWAAWGLLDESLLFDAHDNSALHLPLAVPQGLWAFGLGAFVVMVAVLALEGLFDLLAGEAAVMDRRLGSRGVDEEAEEALAAVAEARAR